MIAKNNNWNENNLGSAPRLEVTDFLLTEHTEQSLYSGGLLFTFKQWRGKSQFTGIINSYFYYLQCFFYKKP